MKKHLLGGLGAVMFVQGASATPPEGTYIPNDNGALLGWFERGVDELRDVQPIASHILERLGDEEMSGIVRDAQVELEAGFENNKVVFVEHVGSYGSEESWRIGRERLTSVPESQRSEWVVINQYPRPGFNTVGKMSPAEVVGAYANSRADDGHEERYTFQHFQLIENIDDLLEGHTLPSLDPVTDPELEGLVSDYDRHVQRRVAEARVAYGGSVEQMLHHMYENSRLGNSVSEELFQEAMQSNPEIIERLRANGLAYLEAQTEILEIIEAHSEHLRELHREVGDQQTEVDVLRSKRKKAEAQQEADEARVVYETARDEVQDQIRETRVPRGLR